MKYIAPPGTTDINAGYVTGVPGIKKGSPVPSEAIEHPMREIVHVIKEAGLTPDEKDLTQLYQAIGKMMPATDGLVPKTQIATTTRTGIVQIGTGLDVDESGLLSTNFGTGKETVCQGDDKRLAADYGYTQTLASNGWTKLPNGLILQWGKVEDDGATYSFPITFPRTCFVLIGTANIDSFDAGGSISAYVVSNSQFRLRNGSVPTVGAPNSYIAIGE